MNSLDSRFRGNDDVRSIVQEAAQGVAGLGDAEDAVEMPALALELDHLGGFALLLEDVGGLDRKSTTSELQSH